jgi:hypothetical protein
VERRGTVVVTALTKRPSFVPVGRGEELTVGTGAEAKVAEAKVAEAKVAEEEVVSVPKKAGTPATTVACDMEGFPTAD